MTTTIPVQRDLGRKPSGQTTSGKTIGRAPPNACARPIPNALPVDVNRKGEWIDGHRTVEKTLNDNYLLAALTSDMVERLRPELELVSLHLGEVLYEPGVELAYAYFPTSGCIISMLYVLNDGSSAEIAMVGSEGVLGLALFMGGSSTPSRAVVQIAGQAYRLDAQTLKNEFKRNGDLQMLLLRYTQALMTQMSQTAVCNRHHSVEQQLCRWLLFSLDRLSSNELNMTQGLIANMLGVRREGATEAAGKLQALGLINYSRGRITILDRPGLERQVCECYSVVKAEYDRLRPTSVNRAPRERVSV